MTNNDIVHGEDFIIEVLVDAAYKAMLCATDGVLRYQQEIITTTTEDSGIWKHKAPRLNEVTLSVTGLTPVNDDDNNVSWFYMMSDAVRTVPQTVRATFRNNNGESKVISGTAIISGGEISGSADDFASSTIDFEFSGGVTMASDVPEDTVPTPLDTPNIVFGDITDTQIPVSWSAVTNADYYILRRATVNDIAFSTVVASGTSLSHTSTRLTPATTYYYWLEAVGSGLYSNSAKDTDNATTDAAAAVTIQLAPPSFSMVANGDDEIIATWGNVTNATEYEFYFNSVDDFGTASLEYTGTLLTNTQTGLTAGTTYYGWVIAIGDGVNYLDSDPAEASATTEAVDPDSIVFDTILSPTGPLDTFDQGAGVYALFLLSSADKEFQFDAISPLIGVDIRLRITVGGSFGCIVDFPSDYIGQPFRFVNAPGFEYMSTFPATKTTIDF